MREQFWPGQEGTSGAVRWSVVQGNKSPNDLRLDIRCARFAPVKMALGFLFSDFYAQNERTLVEEGYLPRVTDPGARYVHFVRGAQLMGWEDAAEQLEFERAEAARKRTAA